MRSSKDGTYYEYIVVYVDDLAICMKDPEGFCDALKDEYKLKLKCIGPVSYHLCCGYTRDEDRTLAADPRNMLAKFLSPMKTCLGRSQRRPGHH